MLKEIPVVEQRYRAVLAVLEDGLTVTEVATKIGVSRQSVHGWLRRYAEGGLDASADRSHRPVSCPHQMDPAVQVRLVELRQSHPTWARTGCCIDLSGTASPRCPAGPRSGGPCPGLGWSTPPAGGSVNVSTGRGNGPTTR
jgi:leucine-zipper of insertion element IS481